MQDKITHYFCEVYRMNIYYCLGHEPEWFEGYMKKTHGLEISCDGSSGKALFNQTKQIIIIWTRKKRDLPSLVHECVHAGTMILESRGVVISHLNDEALAYLVESIFRKAHE